jgi:hypothetical protein
VFRIHDILVWIRIRTPCLTLMDPDLDADPDPATFVIDLQEANKKLIFLKSFSAYYFLKVHLHHFSKIKSPKEVKNSRSKSYSYYFCLMIEGFRSGSGAGSGSRSTPLISRSGSGPWRLKNMWIRWFRIWIWIRNTDNRFKSHS